MAAGLLSRPISQRILLLMLAFFLVSAVFFTSRLGSYLPAAYVPFDTSPQDSGTAAKEDETTFSRRPETPEKSNQDLQSFESNPELERLFNATRHGPWEPPTDLDPQIHGKKLSTIKRPKPAYPLDPFSPTPMVNPATDKNAPWLAAVMCAPWEVRRRMQIRSSWMRLYQDVPFDPRFVIANPGPDWAESIRLENRTHGDMVVLDTIPEDDITANTVKTLVFYKWLLENSPRKYAFISKMDMDLWLNARRFWDHHLVPRLSADGHATVKRTIIGQLFYYPVHKMVFPHGAMYTVTWDMVELLSSLQDKYNVTCGEDMANTILLLNGKEKATLVNFKGSEKFDYDDKDTRPGENSAWASSTASLTAAKHALHSPNAIAVHKLKDDRFWFKVAACFDKEGIKPAPEVEQERTYISKTTAPKSQFKAIPDDYWDYENATWLCNGVWELERGIDRDPDIELVH